MPNTRLGVRTGQALDTRIVAFFKANPHEELTLSDIVTKFGTSRQHAGDIVRLLQMRGDLEYVTVVRLPQSERPAP